jgi:hypothetical protein
MRFFAAYAAKEIQLLRISSGNIGMAFMSMIDKERAP